MTYQWKLSGLYAVDAQTVGTELDRIYQKNGELKPSDVVDESRAENAPLHGLFEWNDRTAAEKYREVQAQNIIRAITVVDEEISVTPTRAFVSVTQNYTPMRIVVQSQDMMNTLLSQAKRDMDMFVSKYETLSELKDVFDVMESVSERIAV